MLLMGVKPEESFRLSFLALIPASIGATGVTMLLSNASIGSVVDTLTFPVVLLMILVAALVGLVSVRTLLKAAGSKRIALLTFVLGALAILSGITSIYFGAG
jgi:undecaprenyl-diphosphatase